MNDSVIKGLVSIVVPFFRTDYDSFLCCIKSLIKQSYEKIEIVIVNDGSGEAYNEKLSAIANLDGRIIVHNLEINSGLSAARNYGLGVSNGEFVIFVDSDDALNTYAIESLYSELINSKCDMAIGGLKVINDYCLLDNEQRYASEILVMSNIDALSRLLTNNGFGSTACGRLAKKTVWQKNGAPFIEGVLHEDLASMWNVVYNCNKIVWCKGNYYYYYQGNNSSIHKKNVTEKFVKDFFDAMHNRNQNLLKLSPELGHDVANSYLIICPQIYIYASICENKRTGLYYKNKALRLFKKSYYGENNIAKLSKKQKLQINLFNISPIIFKFLYILARKLSKRRI